MPAVLVGLLLLGGLGACGTSAYRFTTSRAHALTSPLAGRCWPLPKAARFDFPFQVVRQYRSLDDTRWILVLQWDELTTAEVTAQLHAAFTAGGFDAAGTRDEWTIMSKEGYGDIGFRVDPLTDTADGAVVRGDVRLDLPIRAAHGRRSGRCVAIPYLTPVPTPDTVLGRVTP